MFKRDLNNYMYLSGQKFAVDELDRAEGEHEFSNEYKKQKKALLESLISDEDMMAYESMSKGGEILMKKHNMRRKWSKSAIVATMVIAIGAVSVTTYAAGRYLVENKFELGNILTAGIGNSGEKPKEVAWLQYDFGYVPEGYTEWKPRYYSKNGEYGGKGFYVMQWQGLDTTFEYVENKFETTINGKKAYCYEMGKENTLMRSAIQVLYNDEGAMYELRSETDDITMDELVKIAEGMTVTETGEMVAVVDEATITFDETADEIVDTVLAENVKGSNQLGEVMHQAEFDYCVNAITVQDDLTGLDKDYFYNYEEKIAPFVDENGQFKEFTAKWNAYTDEGISEKSEENHFKVVRANYTVTNTSNEAAEYDVNRMLRKLEANGADYNAIRLKAGIRYKNLSPVGADSLPVYFDQPQYVNEDVRNHYFFINLQPGETVNYEIAWIIYADDIENLAIEENGYYMVNGK